MWARPLTEVSGSQQRTHGPHVDVRPAADVDVDVLDRYRLVVLGSAVYLRRWQPDAVRFLRRHAAQLRSRDVALFQSGPCGPDAAKPDQPEPARVRRLREAVGADSPVTFGGVLDPATARGPVARWMARGALAGDFRDQDRIRRWASAIGSGVTGGALTYPQPSKET